MMRRLAALACCVLALCSYALARTDARLRRDAEVFAQAFTLDVRRPAYVETTRYTAAGDLSFAPLVSATLDDATGPTRIAGLPPELRRLWIASAETLGDQIDAARELMLRAIALRPGWAYHELMLGQLAYVGARRTGVPIAMRERWLAPLRAAAQAAPGDNGTRSSLAAALLEAWGALPEADRAASREAISSAFRDIAFFERIFPAAVSAMGADAALRLVPEDPHALVLAQRIAFLDVRAAAALYQRWEAVERERRRLDLASAEERSRRGDLHGLRRSLWDWVGAHSFRDFCDHEGMAEVARVIELWPEDRAGPWRSDPRGELVRFMLDGRTGLVSGRALARLASSLTGIPDPMKAELYVLAANQYGYEQVVRMTVTLSSFEWTPYLVRLARAQLVAGDVSEASLAVQELLPQARAECEALLVRREVARAREDRTELDAVGRSLSAASPERVSVEAWSRSGSLPLCIDPERPDRRRLRVRLESPAPSLVAYGWDGGRSGTLLVDRSAELDVPLDGLSGRRFFQLTPLAGPPVVPVATALSGVSPAAGAGAPGPL
jgi:hypothetical protein